MAISPVWQEIQQKLELLKQADIHLQIFGAKRHQYRFNSCLTEAEIQDFEQRYRITLPNDYRAFLQYLGNGGAGPDYGILSLEESIEQVQQELIEIPQVYLDRMMPFANSGRMTEIECLEMRSAQQQIQTFITEQLNCGAVNHDFLAEPFPLKNEDALAAIAQRIQDIDSDNPYFYFIEADYPLSGSLPISEKGCGWTSVLVITGEQRGQMWVAGEGWLPEFSNEHATQQDFLGWYQTWLNNSLRSVCKWEAED